LAIRHPDGSPVKLISGAQRGDEANPVHGEGRVIEYADYILQNVQEQRMEKQQIIETFGDPYVYFFGERPRIVQFSGQLISSEDFNWRSQFWKNYDENIRGTKLVQNNARAYISFDTIVVEGYVLTASAIDTADSPYTIPFNLSMLVTNYYDWSNIGQTLFPGAGDKYKNVELLNAELLRERSQFVSTGADVRLMNLQAAGASGILATLRRGIRGINEVIGMASNLVGKIHNIVGGRVVRMPIGIAGYLQSTGAAVVAGGSIGDGNLGAQYDAATGTFKNINGSVKLRAPSSAVFAPAWVSAVTKNSRGYIWENYDEYPNLAEPEKLGSLVSSRTLEEIEDRNIQRQAKVSINDQLLAIYNEGASAGGFLADLAATVGFVKSSFGMIMSARAFVKDPSTILKQSLGIGVGYSSNAVTTETGVTKQSLGIGLGYTSKSVLTNKERQKLAREEGVSKWVGETAIKSFNSLAAGYSTQNELAVPASLGEVYAQSTYQPSTRQLGLSDTDYEAAYGDKDYTLVVSDPLIKKAIDDVYGDRDTAVASTSVRTPEEITLAQTGVVPDISKETLDAVYKTGYPPNAVRTPQAIAAALLAAQNGTSINDEDSYGIRSDADVDATIDPIV
jgi:hypothetical protein